MPADNQDVLITDILSNPPDGVFSIKGELQWSEYVRTVTGHGSQKQLREGKVIGESNYQMAITIWGTDLIESILESKCYQFTNMAISYWNGQVRLTTTTNTQIIPSEETNYDWCMHPFTDKSTIICCPTILSVHLNDYISCPNNDCRKKIDVENNSSKTVLCVSCKIIMLVKNCQKTYSIELIVEKNGKQTKLTAFPECIKQYFHKSGETELKNYLCSMLEFENVDIHFDRKKIITKFQDHCDDMA